MKTNQLNCCLRLWNAISNWQSSQIKVGLMILHGEDIKRRLPLTDALRVIAWQCTVRRLLSLCVIHNSMARARLDQPTICVCAGVVTSHIDRFHASLSPLQRRHWHCIARVVSRTLVTSYNGRECWKRNGYHSENRYIDTLNYTDQQLRMKHTAILSLPNITAMCQQGEHKRPVLTPKLS